MNSNPNPSHWQGVFGILGFALLVNPICAQSLDGLGLEGEDFRIPVWDNSVSIRGGFGYKDNVLLSHTNAQGSAYWMSGAEAMVFRLPTSGWYLSFFADASDVRYFNAPSVRNEQAALAVAQLGRDFGKGWKGTIGLSYMFQNQVFDNAANYTSQSSVGLILGHTLTPRWVLRKTIGPFWVEGEFSCTRQWLETPLDSYWQFGPRVAAGYGWGNGSEIALSYQHIRLDYDTRERLSPIGEAVTNSLLSLDADAFEFSITRNWDAKKRWQTVTSAGIDISGDNGSGFYGNDRVHLLQRLRYRTGKWDLMAQVMWSQYEYGIQTVSATDLELRRRNMLNLVLRAEYKFTKHLAINASWGWDRSLSNLEFDDYEATTMMGGLVWTF